MESKIMAIPPPPPESEVFGKDNIPPPPMESEVFGNARPTALSYMAPAARFGMEVGGALIGGAIGAGTGGIAIPGVGTVPGAAAGGALGYATGKSAADLMERRMGLKPPISSVSQAGKEVAGNLVSGVGMEVGGAAIGKATPYMWRAAKYAGKKMVSAFFGPSIDAINARLLDNMAIKAAKPFDELARELPKDVEKLSSHVGELHDEALESLSTSKALMATENDAGRAVPRDVILKEITLEKTSLGRSVSDASVKAKSVLDRYAERLSNLGPTISENELGHIVRDIDHDIDWEKVGNEPTNKALEGIRTRYSTILKTSNPIYAYKMEPVANGMKLLNDSKQLFLLKREGGQYVPSDITATKIKGLIKEGKLQSREVVDKLKQVTGRDYLQAAEHAHVAEQYIGGRANGARRVAAGAALGGGIGHLAGSPWIGEAAGAATGLLTDIHGGPMAASVVDTIVKLSKMGIEIPSGVISRSMSSAIASTVSQIADKEAGKSLSERLDTP